MWERLIAYFAERHLVTNFIMAGVLVGGVFAWQNTNKEELPDVTFDFVRISVSYPGAPAEDVEYFVTEPIEREIRGLDGVHRITSSSGDGSARISVELERDLPDRDKVFTEIRNSVLNVDLPAEVIDDPNVRMWETSKKAIIDVALYHKDHRILTPEARRRLQSMAFALESQLLTLTEIHSVNRRNWIREEIHIKARPDALRRYEIPFNTVMNEIRANHIRRPAGSLDADQEPKVTLVSELNTPEKLSNLIVQGGFEGRAVRLGEVATIEAAFEKNLSIEKINGHEAVVLNLVKSRTAGILEALEAANRVVDRFQKNNLEGSRIELALLDDESIDVRNRLTLIRDNGILGFVLILIMLFIFLNPRAGFWVAMGLPFSLFFTMIGAHFLGYSVNGTTLAAVIIVLGMVVDDAIVVAENIIRFEHQGMPPSLAVVKGTNSVLMPVIASITTTCVAFIPLFYFSGRHGAMVGFIPPIIFLMLGASLFESTFILPGHLNLRLRKNGRKPHVEGDITEHWFERVEAAYGRFLERVLRFKSLVLLLFTLLLAGSIVIMRQKMKFVMFPDEETRNITIAGMTPPGTERYETAARVDTIEDVIAPTLGEDLVGFRTDIARSRRGGAVEENRFRISIEIVSPEKRERSSDEIVAALQEKVEGLEGFHEIKFRKNRFGQDSGSPIELIVQQNDDKIRAAVVDQLVETMRANPALRNVEPDEPLRVPEYRIGFDREKLKRLSISAGDAASTFRAALEGSILYEFSDGEEEVYVRFTTVDEVKQDLDNILALPVENRGNYLVPLKNIVTVEEIVSPGVIERQELKRTSLIFSDIEKSAKKTPLEIAEYFEAEVFPKILARYPTTTLSFGGEIKDTRESTADLRNAVIMVIALVYIILAILFNSVATPLIIMTAIPFGAVGIILAFYLHGKLLFGFFAAVGALGLAGVVVNDSIVLLSRLKESNIDAKPGADADRQIAKVSRTRLRAVVLTTLTTVAGLLPTAYGFGGYDAMLAEMMLALAWGLMFASTITLFLIPCLFSLGNEIRWRAAKVMGA